MPPKNSLASTAINFNYKTQKGTFLKFCPCAKKISNTPGQKPIVFASFSTTSYADDQKKKKALHLCVTFCHHCIMLQDYDFGNHGIN